MKSWRWSRCAGLLASMLVASSCFHVAEQRSQRDRDIGLAVSGAMRVQVTDGLAAVRQLEPGALRLWMSAPQIELTLDPGEQRGPWRLQLDNALPDARLEGVEAVELEHDGPLTRRVFSFDLQAPLVLRVVAPDAADDSPWRMGFYADVQDAIDRVQDIYSSMNATPGVRFALLGGDLTEQGSEPELERFEAEMATLKFPVYATLGNHELGVDDGAAYQRLFGRASSHFRFRGVGVTLVDSASATIDAAVYDSLEGWLDDSRRGLHVVSMHIAPLDPVGARAGSFASKNEAQKLLQRLAAGGVDLTLYGHVHSYYAFSNARIPAFIAGGGGAIPERLDGIGRHWLTVDVDPIAETVLTGLVRVD